MIKFNVSHLTSVISGVTVFGPTKQHMQLFNSIFVRQYSLVLLMVFTSEVPHFIVALEPVVLQMCKLWLFVYSKTI